jgi:hypothetical protein
MKILGLREAIPDTTTSTMVEVKGNVKGKVRGKVKDLCGWQRN